MKIVFWGTPKYAAENLRTIVNAGHNVIAAVTQPDRKRGRGKKLSPSPVKQAAQEFDIPVYETQAISKDLKTKKILNDLKADVYLVVAFGQILSLEILKQPKLGCWNSHASLLPAWRGAAPIQWSIINDDPITGICIMAMEEGLDTGPVIEQETIDIKDNDNLEILSNRLSIISAKLLLKTLEKLNKTIGLSDLERLKFLNAIKQSKISDKHSYARQIIKEDYLIDWNQNARMIKKKIQGLYPNAYTIFNGKRIKVTEVYLPEITLSSTINNSINKNKGYKVIPGEIITIKKGAGITLMTNDFPITIKYGQLEGRKNTDGYTLSVQNDLKVKNILGV